MELGFWTFTGHGFTYDEAVKDAETKVRAWQVSNQWRGPKNEILYSFQHGTLVEQRDDGPLYSHVISAFGPISQQEGLK